MSWRVDETASGANKPSKRDEPAVCVQQAQVVPSPVPPMHIGAPASEMAFSLPEGDRHAVRHLLFCSHRLRCKENVHPLRECYFLFMMAVTALPSGRARQGPVPRVTGQPAWHGSVHCAACKPAAGDARGSAFAYSSHFCSHGHAMATGPGLQPLSGVFHFTLTP